MLSVVLSEHVVLVALADILLLRLVACLVVKRLESKELRRVAMVNLRGFALHPFPFHPILRALLHIVVKLTIAKGEEGLALQRQVATQCCLLEHLHSLLGHVDLVDANRIPTTLIVAQQPPAITIDTGLRIADSQIVATLFKGLAVEQIERVLHHLHLLAEIKLALLPPLMLTFPRLAAIKPLTPAPRLHIPLAHERIIEVFLAAMLIVIADGHGIQPLDGLIPLAEAHILGANLIAHGRIVQGDVTLEELVELGVGRRIDIIEELLRAGHIERVEVEARASAA